MPHGLAVAAHQLGPASGVAGPGSLGLNQGECLTQLQDRGSGLGQALPQLDQRAGQACRIGHMAARQDLPEGPRRRALQLHEHRINAIGAGATHQPQHPHGAQRLGSASRDSLVPITTNSSSEWRM